MDAHRRPHRRSEIGPGMGQEGGPDDADDTDDAWAQFGACQKAHESVVAPSQQVGPGGDSGAARSRNLPRKEKGRPSIVGIVGIVGTVPDDPGKPESGPTIDEGASSASTATDEPEEECTWTA